MAAADVKYEYERKKKDQTKIDNALYILNYWMRRIPR